MDETRELLWERIKELKMETISDELRNEGIIAPYVNMRISLEDYVMRFAIPVRE